MLDESLAALRRRGLALPAPMVVADKWFIINLYKIS
jgi:hypothetical protein